jgi:hypothetical protein
MGDTTPRSVVLAALERAAADMALVANKLTYGGDDSYVEHEDLAQQLRFLSGSLAATLQQWEPEHPADGVTTKIAEATDLAGQLATLLYAVDADMAKIRADRTKP